MDKNQLLTNYWHQAKMDYINLSSNGYDPVYLSALHNDLEALKFWISIKKQQGLFDKYYAYPNGVTLLYLAASKNNLDILKYLIEEEFINPNFLPKKGYSLLGFASTNASDPIFDYLLSLPFIKINIRDTVEPFVRPFDQLLKLQDLDRLLIMLSISTANKNLLNKSDLELMHKKIDNKDALNLMLSKYIDVVFSKMSLKSKQDLATIDLKLIKSQDFVLNLLAYVHANILIYGNIDFSICVNKKQYSDETAWQQMLISLTDTFKTGDLSPSTMIYAFRQVLNIQQAINNTNTTNNNLEEAFCAGLIKQQQRYLKSDTLSKFSSSDVLDLSKSLRELNIFNGLMANYFPKLAQEINNYLVSINNSLTKFSAVIPGTDISDQLERVYLVMLQQDIKNLSSLQNKLNTKSLTKETMSFLQNKKYFAPEDSSPQNKNNKKPDPKN